jgi:hypothetical protein
VIRAVDPTDVWVSGSRAGQQISALERRNASTLAGDSILERCDRHFQPFQAIIHRPLLRLSINNLKDLEIDPS